MTESSKALEITWLGQGGFLLESDSVRVVVDPYLSNSLSARGLERLFPVPLSIEQLRPKMVVCTHDHADHFDEQTMVPLHTRFPGCKIVGPASVVNHCRSVGFDMSNVVPLNCGDVYLNYGVSVKGVKAFHSDAHAVGLLIVMAGRTIYISGDTTLEPELESTLRRSLPSSIDLMMICINGKLGNMDHTQAASLTVALHPKMVVPMHYGLFAENTADPEPFAQAMHEAGIGCRLMQVGKVEEF